MMSNGIGRLSLNVGLNTLSTLVNALTGFLTLPFLIGQLGVERYGLWVLVVGVTGYFLLLDFGISGAVGRLVAGCRARDDRAGLDAVLSTTFGLLLLVGGVVALATLAVPGLFAWIFDVPPAARADVTRALIIVGFSSALYFPAATFYGYLWGSERFDLHNLVEIPVLVGRTATIFLVMTRDSSLTDLAIAVSAWTIAGYLGRAAMCFRIDPTLRIVPTRWSRAVVHEVFAFGGWFGLLVFIRQTMPQVATFVIGHGLGSTAVTVFTVPRLLAAYSNWFMMSATQALAPRAAALHSGGRHDDQRALYVGGGRWAYALALFFAAGLVVLGAPLLAVWQPHDQQTEYQILVILMAGEILPMSQWMTYNALVGMGRHRRLVGYGIAEIAAILVGSALVMPVHGLVGVAAVVAAAGFLFRGVLQLSYGGRVLGVRAGDYVRQVYLPVTIAATLPVALTAALVAGVEPDGWIGVFACGAAFGLAYWATLLPVLAGRDRMAGIRARFARAF
jgi:O-antigen/teichoic acid export membrane protein